VLLGILQDLHCVFVSVRVLGPPHSCHILYVGTCPSKLCCAVLQPMARPSLFVLLVSRACGSHHKIITGICNGRAAKTARPAGSSRSRSPHPLSGHCFQGPVALLSRLWRWHVHCMCTAVARRIHHLIASATTPSYVSTLRLRACSCWPH
jgi:hypothetical protein